MSICSLIKSVSEQKETAFNRKVWQKTMKIPLSNYIYQMVDVKILFQDPCFDLPKEICIETIIGSRTEVCDSKA